MCRFNSHVASNHSDVCSCRMCGGRGREREIRCTLPLKISIDIITKSIRETNVLSPKMKKWIKEERRRDVGNVCGRWMCVWQKTAFFNLHLVHLIAFPNCIYWCVVLSWKARAVPPQKLAVFYEHSTDEIHTCSALGFLAIFFSLVFSLICAHSTKKRQQQQWQRQHQQNEHNDNDSDDDNDNGGNGGKCWKSNKM